LTPLAAHLETQGFDPVTADMWGKFVGAVVAALLAAKQSLKSESEWAEFCAATGAFGKARKTGPHANRRLPTEEGISGELTERMNDVLRATPDDHVLRKWHVVFDNEGRVRSRRKKGKHSERTDIRARGQKLDGPEFVLEAKVVDTPSQVRSRLLGPKGLGRFTAKEPYTEDRVAGLLAYTVRHETAIWLQRIEAGYAGPPPLASTTAQIIVEPNDLIAVCAPVERRAGLESVLMLNIVLRFGTKAA
jgi:hypothetical protein